MPLNRGDVLTLLPIAKSRGWDYNPAIVARTWRDLHVFVHFADRSGASVADAGCASRRLTASFDRNGRADGPAPNSK
jgi:hypothetical protein